ncbi:carbon-nitrogen hydrolase family protein [Alicyclobacillus sp. ALC3]|uniref:carbon-nitrogen hydrolase family protein n=1 Tax=Alicyclobacillus sp. ALC3 TaxID=2796143 RepID=UPI002379285E|nr:nitrilase-related carbon-nitrogen hydrolase [Alicyclobacillus sp. ALC3]WDL99086.1 hypothetical protein JC200_10795 [Alicyclobacillus sp. ALC3]
MEQRDWMRLGLVQDTPVVKDMEGTLGQMERYAAEAGRSGRQVNLLAYPELYVTGYYPEYWERRPTPQDELDWLARMQEVAAREDLFIVFGHPSYRAQTVEHGTSRYGVEMAGDGRDMPLYNAASLVSPQGLVGTYAKVHLFGSEAESFVPGDVFPVWQTPWGKLAVQICFDVEFPEGARIAGLHGAQIILFPADNMHPFGPWHRTFTAARALENGVFAATVNRLGPEFDTDFCGGSCCMHPNGEWLIEAQPDAGLFVCDIDVNDLADRDATVDYYRLRRPNLYRDLVK